MFLSCIFKNTLHNLRCIEGQQLNLESLRSSVAHRLALADAPGTDRSVEGLVQVMQDALANHSAALDVDKLCRWQSALFPGGTSGIVRIAVGRLRDHADAMQIVSGPLGPLGREVEHDEAPPSARVGAEMDRFLAWFANPDATLNGIARAALVHLWFESITFFAAQSKQPRVKPDRVALNFDQYPAVVWVRRIDQQIQFRWLCERGHPQAEAGCGRQPGQAQGLCGGFVALPVGRQSPVRSSHEQAVIGQL
jgi:hypothetical protein